MHPFVVLCSPRKLSHTRTCNKGHLWEARAGKSPQLLLGSLGRWGGGGTAGRMDVPSASRSPESKIPQVLCGTEFHGYMDLAGTEPAPTDAGDEKWSLKIFRDGFRVYLESENWGADVPVVPISPQRGLETCPESQRRWCGLGSIFLCIINHHSCNDISISLKVKCIDLPLKELMLLSQER